MPVQYGGGLRSAEAVAAALGAGAERVILGTAAFTDPELLAEVLCRTDPGQIGRVGRRARRPRRDPRLAADD